MFLRCCDAKRSFSRVEKRLLARKENSTSRIQIPDDSVSYIWRWCFWERHAFIFFPIMSKIAASTELSCLGVPDLGEGNHWIRNQLEDGRFPSSVPRQHYCYCCRTCKVPNVLRNSWMFNNLAITSVVNSSYIWYPITTCGFVHVKLFLVNIYKASQRQNVDCM